MLRFLKNITLYCLGHTLNLKMFPYSEENCLFFMMQHICMSLQFQFDRFAVSVTRLFVESICLVMSAHISDFPCMVSCHRSTVVDFPLLPQPVGFPFRSDEGADLDPIEVVERLAARLNFMGAW